MATPCAQEPFLRHQPRCQVNWVDASGIPQCGTGVPARLSPGSDCLAWQLGMLLMICRGGDMPWHDATCHVAGWQPLHSLLALVSVFCGSGRSIFGAYVWIQAQLQQCASSQLWAPGNPLQLLLEGA